VFGTVLNRMVVEAVCGYPLTVDGSGHQIRGMLHIRDTVECIRLAAEHPADPSEFGVFNQFTEQFSVLEIAEMIRNAFAGPVRIARIDDARVEAANHCYHAEHSRLTDGGLQLHLLNDTLIESLFAVAEKHRGHADPLIFAPSVQWTETSSHAGPEAIGAGAA
jgi:UDP-sulfoquinovose synthase